MRRIVISAVLFAIALQGCSRPSSGGIPPSTQPQIAARRVEGGIQQQSLWRHLSEFQRIANANPGSDGHGSRDTGTPGYKASVAYVATLMKQAGYTVAIQRYNYLASAVAGIPEFRTAARSYAFDRDFFVARHSAGGTLTAHVQAPSGSASGCAAADFAGFARGNIALLEHSTCAIAAQVVNAQSAGAAAVVLYAPEGGGYEARLTQPARIPVIGVVSTDIGKELVRQYAHIDIHMQLVNGIDYNLIADSPYGNPNRVVTIEAHLDSIYGAGMLDNASGSTTILEVALNMAKTPTRNHLRYLWFGGEEIGLLGSAYYTKHLSAADRHRIRFDVDVDVTATPNFDILVADAANAYNVREFPPNVVPQSRVGNDAFADFFALAGVVSRPASFGNDGTDSNSFSLVGIPNTGVLTEQDCCKQTWETNLWGGFRGNYEGKIPSFNGGCVDIPDRWCDNLSNNDPFVLELVSKAVAHVTSQLANDPALP